jgi:hypothetical protein
VERKIEMALIERLVASFIERACGNWITTVIGILVGAAGLIGGATQVIPASLVWHGVHVVSALGTVATLVGAVALILAKDKGIKIDLPKVGALLLCLLLPAIAHAQAAEQPLKNIYAAGGSYSVNGNPAIAGTALYAHLLAGSGTYAFTAVDALPNTVKPFTVTSNVGMGIGQKVLTLGTVPVYMPTAAGVSWSGTHMGWQWNGGVLASIKLKDGYYLMPSVRFLKSSVSNGSGYQPIIGLLFGWGK